VVSPALVSAMAEAGAIGLVPGASAHLSS
jgi:hypothetical protein